MPQIATAGKKAAAPLQVRGAGHHNLLVIRDYSTGDITFRAETEIRQTTKNEKGFERLESLLKKPSLAAAETQEIVDFLHHEVDLMKDDGTPDGKERAKAIFSAAFGLSA